MRLNECLYSLQVAAWGMVWSVPVITGLFVHVGTDGGWRSGTRVLFLYWLHGVVGGRMYLCLSGFTGFMWEVADHLNSLLCSRKEGTKIFFYVYYAIFS